MQEEGKTPPEDMANENEPAEAAPNPEDAARDAVEAPESVGDAPAEGEGGEAAQIAELTEENAALKDRLMRTLAELENTRKRAARDREDAQKYAVQKFARDMCEVADNLQRALDAAPADEDGAAISAEMEGVRLTQASLKQIFERHGVVPIDAKDQKFDPNLHEAMTEIDVPGAPPGTCIEVVETGYTLNGRLLRPARVIVTKAQSRSSGQKVDTQA